MDQFTHRTLVTSPNNLTYSYYLSPGFNEKLSPSVPVLMLVHGYPDSAHMWEGAVPLLLKLPYPMMIPDLLGFAGSDKPKEAHYYNYKFQADALAQILDKEGVGNNVIPIGHDWGSATSQRFYLYHKHRCIGLGLISLAYQIPHRDAFDLDKVNKATEQRFGYPQWEYWNFFCRPDAPELMEKNLARFWEVNHGNYPSPKPEENGRDIWMREMFCVPGQMYEYVTGTGRFANYTVELKPYKNGEKLKREFMERLGRDGFTGPVNYYHSLANNTMLEDERWLCDKDENGADRRTIDVPLLYIGETGDWVCRTDLMQDAVKEGLIKNDMEEKVVEAGHWVLQEKPEEIATLISEWLVKKFPVSK